MHEVADARSAGSLEPGVADHCCWSSAQTYEYPPLTTDVNADVVVAGAGLTGLSIAYQLAKAGKNVVVLEGRSRGAGQTGRYSKSILIELLRIYIFHACAMDLPGWHAPLCTAVTGDMSATYILLQCKMVLQNGGCGAVQESGPHHVLE